METPRSQKADGREPVQAYLDAMPGWKHDVGVVLDRLVLAALPDAQQAVRWNSPFYGVEGQGWFLSFHCFTNYVKVTFLNGGSLDPEPPVRSKHDDVRYLHVGEDGQLDEQQFTDWVVQASRIPGEDLF